MKIASAFLAGLLCSTAFAGDRFVSESLGFEMATPSGPAGTTGQASAIFYLPMTDQFAANVNYTVQEFEGTIEKYRETSLAEFKGMKLKPIKSEILGQVLTVEYAGMMQGRELHWYSRAMKRGNKILLVTATALQSRWYEQKPALVKSVDSAAWRDGEQSRRGLTSY